MLKQSLVLDTEIHVIKLHLCQNPIKSMYDLVHMQYVLKLTLCGQEAFYSIFMTVSTIKVSTKRGLLSSRSGR